MIHILVTTFYSYLLVGLLVAAAFLWRGVSRIDPVAKGSGLGFRLLLIPGSIFLWPLLLLRWLGGRTAPVEHTAHRDWVRRR